MRRLSDSGIANDRIHTLTSQIENIGDPRYVRALGHPLRVRILAILEERTASAVELSRMLQADIGVVAYHVRKLHQLGLIELERETRVRGAIQRHYRAYERPRVSDDAWEQAPPIAKQAAVDAALQQIYDYGRASNAAGGFDRRDAHITRTALRLDSEGWEKLARPLRRVLEDVAEIEGEVAAREAAGEAEGVEGRRARADAVRGAALLRPAPDGRRLAPELREQRVVELVATRRARLRARERRAGRVRRSPAARRRRPAAPRTRAGAREPAAAWSVSMLKATASPGSSAQPRIVEGVAVGLDVRASSPKAPSSNTSARSSKNERGMYQVPDACEPATNSSVLSRGTGSSGIQNETVWEPSML